MSIGIDGGQKTRGGIAILRRTVVVRRCWEGGGLRHPISRYMYELFPPYGTSVIYHRIAPLR